MIKKILFNLLAYTCLILYIYIKNLCKNNKSLSIILKKVYLFFSFFIPHPVAATTILIKGLSKLKKQ